MEGDRQLRDLRILLEVSQAMGGERSLDSLLQVIVDKAKEVMEADRCSLFLYEESTNELWSKFAEQLGTLREIRFPVGVGIAGDVARTRKAANIPDAYADSRFNPEFDPQTGYRTRSVLCVPMISSRGNLIGVLQVLNKRNGGIFDEQDQALLGAFGGHAAIALERARLTDAYLEKQRMEDALRLAHEIQMSLLPRRFPPFPSLVTLDLYAAIAPAKQVSGDFYDFFLLDEDHLFFVVGDVSGKGVPAALFMAVAKTLLKSSARKGIGPAQVLTEVNTELCANNDSGTFVTIFCAVLDTRTGEVQYANAGHNPPLLIRHSKSVEYVNEGGGLIAGVMDPVIYENQRLHLDPGDSLLLYTDGVTEAVNEKRGLFSQERLMSEAAAMTTLSSQEMVERIIDRLRVYSQGMPQSDDITIMSVRLKADGH